MINSNLVNNLKALKTYLNENDFLLLNDVLENYNDIINYTKSLKYDKISEPDLRCYSHAKDFEHKEFLEIIKFAEKITNKSLQNIEILKFETGDFTLQHYNNSFNGYEAYLFLSDDWNTNYRGELVYVYEDPLIINATNNSLFIINKPEDVNRFIKKINYKAQNKSFYVIRLS